MLVCDRENKTEIDEVMSNFDHCINNEVAEQLKAGDCFAGYAAWDFHGDVWYENGIYHCEIWRYHVHIDTISNEDLKEIMNEASDKYGWN